MKALSHRSLEQSDAPEGMKDRANLEVVVEGFGGKLIVADVRRAPGAIHHDIGKLNSVFRHIFTQNEI